MQEHVGSGAGGMGNRGRSEHRRRNQGYPIAADEEKGSDRPKNHERIPACGPDKGLPRSRGCHTNCFRRVLCRHSLLSTCSCVSSHASRIVSPRACWLSTLPHVVCPTMAYVRSPSLYANRDGVGLTLSARPCVVNRPVVYNSMGAAATPALAYEKHVRSMLCRILVLYWPSNTVAEFAAADVLGLGLIRRRSLWLPPQGLLL